MKKEPETYEELIRYKRCIDLSSHYDLSQEELDRIYNYLATYSDAVIVGNENSLTLKVNYKSEIQPEVITAKCIDSSIDGIKLTKDTFTIIPHYVPSSSGGYSGGSSSNNNNNNIKN